MCFCYCYDISGLGFHRTSCAIQLRLQTKYDFDFDGKFQFFAIIKIFCKKVADRVRRAGGEADILMERFDSFSKYIIVPLGGVSIFL